MTEERRHYQRISTHLAARLKIVGSPTPRFSTTVFNVGAEGICFTSKLKVDVGQEAECELKLGGEEKVVLKTLIIWSQIADDSKHYKVGAKIIDAASEDRERFVRFYCQNVFGVS